MCVFFRTQSSQNAEIRRLQRWRGACCAAERRGHARADARLGRFDTPQAPLRSPAGHVGSVGATSQSLVAKTENRGFLEPWPEGPRVQNRAGGRRLRRKRAPTSLPPPQPRRAAPYETFIRTTAL